MFKIKTNTREFVVRDTDEELLFNLCVKTVLQHEEEVVKEYHNSVADFLEKQFEKLYGLGAVSQAKPIFESYQNGIQTLLSKPSRLSSKQEQLERLEGNFREEITSLQVRLNSDFERRAMARRLSATVE